MDIEKILFEAKSISKDLAILTSKEKNDILFEISNSLVKNVDKILLENKKDIDNAKKLNLGSMIDRLLLTEERIINIASDIKNIIKIDDEIGKVIKNQNTKNSFNIKKIKTPLGVIVMIYESRPNVTIDAFSLAFKTGNSIVLKGGKESLYSNKIFVEVIQKVLSKYNLTLAVQLLEDNNRKYTLELLNAKGKIDLLIPRGGKGLINFVLENSKVPIIQTGASVVHTFVDEFADLEMAKNIIINEKTRRVSVCNALDTLIIHEKVEKKFIDKIFPLLQKKNVIVHGYDEKNLDYSKEWLSYDLSIKVVKNLDDALSHISKYSLGHSECIITENKKHAEKFLKEVDAACVYHNVSTCFSDGAEFGLGAEIGVSTQKLHARGPFACESLTTYKWVIEGAGEVRD
jgi:glutamate-5-semialdehyde dehydrogenase